MKISADFERLSAPMRPLHGVGQAPLLGLSDQFMHYIGEAGFPYSRLHDTGGMYGAGRYVDIPNIFRDFDADENDPASYDFVFTDWLLQQLQAQGAEPIYRLGVTIENAWEVKSYRIAPPKDFGKWARICEHIIRHYNEGWANGFHMGITYWEIWNEPEGSIFTGKVGAMWLGTQAQYFELYETTAKHLKACFGDSIKVGGYAAIGFFYALLTHPDPDCNGYPDDYEPVNNSEYWLQYAHQFLRFVRDSGSPLDFFSWHTYGHIPDIVGSGRYIRKMLNRYGFEKTEDMLNEWNICHDVTNRATAMAAASALGAMLAMQKETVTLMTYYDARIGASQYGGIFNPDTWTPYKTYYAFMAFNRAYRLGTSVETDSDGENVFVCGSTDGKKKLLLLANVSEQAAEAEFEINGAALADAEILMIDDTHFYTPTGQSLKNGTLTLPPYSCVEIRFW